MSVNNHTPADQKELDSLQEELDAARAASTQRSEKVDDLTTRFRELRRKNHFRLMLEELFND
jgi:hypothetical protein